MSVNYYNIYGLKEVINASGKMTILGVSTVSDRIVAAQKFGGQHFFEMADLIEKTGQYVARLLKTEDAHVVSCASAGIAQGVAALIGRGCERHLHQPYNTHIAPKREIILPKGHNIDYGAPIELMIAQGGGQLIEAGYANECHEAHIERMITPQTAGILYVKSHHTVQKNMLSPSAAVALAKKHQLPVIIDAAAEEDLFTYTQLGAELVIYSGAKALNGPSSGLVLGKSPYVGWVRQQGKGLGRSMKVGKENILGLVEALEAYLQTPKETGEQMKKRLAPFVERINQIHGLMAQVVQDGSGRDIYRASVKAVGFVDAKTIVAKQKETSPAIYTREYQVNQGIIEYDIRAVDEAGLDQIIQRLKEIVGQ